MRLRSVLPVNRWLVGRLWLEDDAGIIIAGPYRCRGKADSQIAAEHDNPERVTTRPFGDHPSGTYRVAAIVKDKPPAHTYGDYFFLLDPTAGDALEAEEAERRGLAIHGGDLSHDGVTLRATEGCLRTTNAAMIALAALVTVGVEYYCEDVEALA